MVRTVVLSACVFVAFGCAFTASPSDHPPASLAPQNERPLIFLGESSGDVRIQLQVAPDGKQLVVRVLDSADQPLDDISLVSIQFIYLDEERDSETVTADPQNDDEFTVTRESKLPEGMTLIRVQAEREGQATAALQVPYWRAPVSVSNQHDPAALAFLERAEQPMNILGALRARQELNNGQNGLSVTEVEFLAPNLSRSKVEGQGDAIAVGDRQYFQAPDGSWTERERLTPFVFPDFHLAPKARLVRFGPSENVGSVAAQVVRFQVPSGGISLEYAIWIDPVDFRLLQQAIVAPEHYLLERFRDWDAGDIVISLPDSGSGAVSQASSAPSRSATDALATQETAAPSVSPDVLPTAPPSHEQTRTLGSLSAAVRIEPHVFESTTIEIGLTEAGGVPPLDIARVDVALAMQGMNHGAMGIEAVREGTGKYRAEGMLLVMEGSWYLALQVVRSSGVIESGVFAFRVPDEKQAGTAKRFYQRPPGGVAIHDVAVYPESIEPRTLHVEAARPVRLLVMYVDFPFCGPRVILPEYNSSTPVSPEGLAQLEFVPTRTETLELVCESDGLVLRPQD